LTTRPVTPNYTGRVGVFAVPVQGTFPGQFEPSGLDAIAAGFKLARYQILGGVSE
jgi:hypothetical protein